MAAYGPVLGLSSWGLSPSYPIEASPSTVERSFDTDAEDWGMALEGHLDSWA